MDDTMHTDVSVVLKGDNTEVPAGGGDVVSSPLTPEPSVEDLAAHDYRKLLPEFEVGIHDMSRRQLERVILAIMRYPLEDNKPQFSYPFERTAFMQGMQILDCKLVLMKAVLELTKNKEAMAAFKEDYDRLTKEPVTTQGGVEVPLSTEGENNASVSG